MSDFLFSSRPGEHARLADALRRTLPDAAGVRELDGRWGSVALSLARHDPPRLHQDDSGIVALAGFPLLAAGTRRRIETDGDMAALSHAACGSDVDWTDLLDGPFALLLVAPDGTARVVTDRMSFVPVYVCDDAARTVAGTHPDAVALAAGVQDDFDAISIADFVANESIAHPYTAYRTVRVLEPASITTLAGRSTYPYWQPEEGNPFADRREAAQALRAALVEQVEVTLSGVDRAALLFSAGEDARAVLGAVPDPSSIVAVTFAENENREVRLARRAAAAYGARFVHGARATDHYAVHFDRLARLAGSQHRFIDIHAFGFHEALQLDALDVVIGGFSADTLLKLEYAARTPERPRRLDGIRPDLLDGVAQRRAAHLERVRRIRPSSAHEWAAMWPAQVRKATGNIQGNRRLMRMYEPYMCNRIVDIAAAVPQAWKRNRVLFHEAVRPLLRASWYVPHVRSRYPWFGRNANLLLGAGLNLTRGLSDRLRGMRDRQGGWTDPSDLLHTGAMRSAVERLPLGTLADLFVEPAAAEASIRRWPPRAQLLVRQMARVFAG